MKFITMSNSNWVDPIKSTNMAKGRDSPKKAHTKKSSNKLEHADPGKPQLTLPPLLAKEFPDFEWTADYVDMAAKMSGIIAGFMEADRSSTGGPKKTKGKKSKATTATSKHLPSQKSLDDIVARALPELNIEHAKLYEPLHILYRHGFDWRTLDLRSVPEKSWSYAYRLIFASYVHELTWGRMLYNPTCRKLKRSLFRFLAERAHPFATTRPGVSRDDLFPDSPSRLPIRVGWANWDSSLVDNITARAKVHGLVVESSHTHPPKLALEASKRWQEYGAEAKKIITTVRDMTCAQAGFGTGLLEKPAERELDPSVAACLYRLIQVRQPFVIFLFFAHSIPSISTVYRLERRSSRASPYVRIPLSSMGPPRSHRSP